MRKREGIADVCKCKIPDAMQMRMLAPASQFMWRRPKEVWYIGGSEVLPPPLEPEKEAKAIAGLNGATQTEAREILIEHNLRLVVYIAKKFDNTGVGVEDLISIGTIGLIKAINTYNPDKNIKLATYASRCIENEILMHLRRTNKTRMEVSFDEPLNVDWDGNELLLSDILGTDEDVIYRDMEMEVEYRLLRRAISKVVDRERMYYPTEIWTWKPRRRRKNTERSGRCAEFPSLTFPAWRSGLSDD